jgi:hypothetical protein
MMYIFFGNLVVFLPAYLQVRPDAAISKAMFPPEQHLIGKPVVGNIPLNNLKQTLIAPGKARAPQTNNNFTALIHPFMV